MTPAINLLVEKKIEHRIHEYEHDPAHESYGLEAAEKMAVPAARVFKTLVVAVDGGQLAVAIVPVSAQLGMKAMARALGAKKAEMADAKDVQRATCYVLGGVSPLGQKRRLRTIVDDSARSLATMFVSAGRRGLEIELKPDDLAELTEGKFAAISQR